jgi:transcriptional regulator with XRE-family HTH domain
MTSNHFTQLVACAAKLLGGERQLARYLGSETAQVEQWLKGIGEPPVPVYSRLSGLLARDINRYAASRPSPVIRLGASRTSRPG